VANGEPTDDLSTPDPAGATGRRDFMRRAAVVGTSAFVVPRIVTVDPADAQALTSPPPELPGRPDPPPVQEAGPPGHRVSARTRHPADPGGRPPGDRTHGAAPHRRQPRSPRRRRAGRHGRRGGAGPLERRSQGRCQVRRGAPQGVTAVPRTGPGRDRRRVGIPVTEDRPDAVSRRTAQTAAEPSRGAGAGGQLGTDRCPRLPRGTASGVGFGRALGSLV
jgi:hypothetical protein